MKMHSILFTVGEKYAEPRKCEGHSKKRKTRLHSVDFSFRIFEWVPNEMRGRHSVGVAFVPTVAKINYFGVTKKRHSSSSLQMQIAFTLPSNRTLFNNFHLTMLCCHCSAPLHAVIYAFGPSVGGFTSIILTNLIYAQINFLSLSLSLSLPPSPPFSRRLVSSGWVSSAFRVRLRRELGAFVRALDLVLVQPSHEMPSGISFTSPYRSGLIRPVDCISDSLRATFSSAHRFSETSTWTKNTSNWVKWFFVFIARACIIHGNIAKKCHSVEWLNDKNNNIGIPVVEGGGRRAGAARKMKWNKRNKSRKETSHFSRFK